MDSWDGFKDQSGDQRGIPALAAAGGARLLPRAPLRRVAAVWRVARSVLKRLTEVSSTFNEV
jgi:hypothetical protein